MIEAKLTKTQDAIVRALADGPANVLEIRRRVKATSPHWRVWTSIALGGLYVETRELARLGVITRVETFTGAAARGMRPAYFYGLNGDARLAPLEDEKTRHVAEIAYRLLEQIPPGTERAVVTSILTTTVLEGLRMLQIDAADFALRLVAISMQAAKRQATAAKSGAPPIVHPETAVPDKADEKKDEGRA